MHNKLSLIEKCELNYERNGEKVGKTVTKKEKRKMETERKGS